MINFNFKLTDKFITPYKYNGYIYKSLDNLEILLKNEGKGSDFTGWTQYDKYINNLDLPKITNTANKLSEKSDLIVVCGIGGSYLGAKAILDVLPGNNKIRFAGYSLSSFELDKLMNEIGNKDFSLIVISKSGTTTETSLAFRLLKEKLIKKYNNDSYSRIVAVTDKDKGALVKFCNKYKCPKFIIPDNIGGRYSVFTPVGLFPIACAGHNIELIKKAIISSIDNFRIIEKSNPVLTYATIRNCLYSYGFKTEFMITYEESLRSLIEWWKQLFGESEGKDWKGILPHGAIFTSDLHSLGQYLQNGERRVFETVLKFKPHHDFFIPKDQDNFDNFNSISNESLNKIENIAYYATSIAHYDGGVPINIINLNEVSLSSLSKLMLFFMFACGVSGYLLDVNPFNQPGVENYKKNMKALMGNSKLKKLKKELDTRIKEIF